jgi:hypothetical protein
MPTPGEVKDASIAWGIGSVESFSPPVLVSLGPHVDGAALPRPDLQHAPTSEAGARKRILAATPTIDRARLMRFRLFVRNWIRKNLNKLDPQTDVSFDTWVENTNYPAWRKDQLRKTWEDLGNKWDPELWKAKCFIKDESYAEFKHARNIFSRSDSMKVVFGPYFKAIENVLYKHEAFIKHVPVADRPAYIKKLLERNGAKYIQTDYSAFESHFIPELMEACEFELYDYLLEEVEGGKEMCALLRAVLQGDNVCQFKWFTLLVEATRLSGEMNTSLGNGFTNLMAMLFLCEESGASDVAMVVEGDDGITSHSGPAPTPADFASIGLTIKLEPVDQLSEASFCGIVFDPEDGINVTDVRKEIVKFGWTSNVYRRSRSNKLKVLLRAKSLSLAHQYPGCPILESLARYGLRMTRGVDIRCYVQNSGTLDTWQRAQLLAAMHDEKSLSSKFRRPGMATRWLVRDRYGIDIMTQISIEEYFDKKSDLKPIDHPGIWFLMEKDWIKYFEEYSESRSRYDPWLDFPLIRGNFKGFSDIPLYVKQR